MKSFISLVGSTASAMVLPVLAAILLLLIWAFGAYANGRLPVRSHSVTTSRTTFRGALNVRAPGVNLSVGRLGAPRGLTGYVGRTRFRGYRDLVFRDVSRLRGLALYAGGVGAYVAPPSPPVSGGGTTYYSPSAGYAASPGYADRYGAAEDYGTAEDYAAAPTRDTGACTTSAPTTYYTPAPTVYRTPAPTGSCCGCTGGQAAYYAPPARTIVYREVAAPSCGQAALRAPAYAPGYALSYAPSYGTGYSAYLSPVGYGLRALAPAYYNRGFGLAYGYGRNLFRGFYGHHRRR